MLFSTNSTYKHSFILCTSYIPFKRSAWGFYQHQKTKQHKPPAKGKKEKGNCRLVPAHTGKRASYQNYLNIISADMRDQGSSSKKKKEKTRRPGSMSCTPNLLQYGALTVIGRHCVPTTTAEGLAVRDLYVNKDCESQQTNARNRPILTPKTVLPLFFVVGVIFAPLGGLLLWASSKVVIRHTSFFLPEITNLETRLRRLSLTIQLASRMRLLGKNGILTILPTSLATMCERHSALGSLLRCLVGKQ